MQNTEIDMLNWHEVLRELETIFLSRQDAGSAESRHIEQLLKNMEYLRDDISVQERPPQSLDVNRRFPVRTFVDKTTDYAALISDLDQVSEMLRWEQGYENIPEDLKDSFAYCHLMGVNSHIYSEKMVIGLMLLAPRTDYPAHKHEDIQSLYLCLTGKPTINGSLLGSGDTYFVETSSPHEIRTGDAPTLLLYSWLGNKRALVENRMKFIDNG